MQFTQLADPKTFVLILKHLRTAASVRKLLLVMHY
jgi:hypothetical protein